MPERYLFEYAVVRIVPRVEREEFINVGVILYCPKRKFLSCMSTLNEQRLGCFTTVIDIDEIKQHLHAFGQICCGSKDGGAIARLDDASRFRWLTATRSTVVQSSKVHPGLCVDPQETLEKLHRELVL
nr:DUF3037 domain-containing protein [Mucilaginibacter yixingensis]